MVSRSERCRSAGLGADGEESQPIVQTGFEPVQAQRRVAGRGQLDRQRYPVQSPAQRGRAGWSGRVVSPAPPRPRGPRTGRPHHHRRRRSRKAPGPGRPARTEASAAIRLVASTVSPGSRRPSGRRTRGPRPAGARSCPTGAARRVGPARRPMPPPARAPTAQARPSLPPPSRSRRRDRQRGTGRRTTPVAPPLGDSPATLIASRVLPIPPGPIAVTSALARQGPRQAARSTAGPGTASPGPASRAGGPDDLQRRHAGPGCGGPAVELAHQRRHVTFHRAYRDEQRLGDLRVRQVLADQRKDLRLACRHPGAERRHALSVPREGAIRTRRR